MGPIVLGRGTVAALALAALPAGPVAAQDGSEPPSGDTAGTVFDIIAAHDPTAFPCLEPQGQEPRQICDKRVNGEPVVEAHLFLARFADGVVIEIAVAPEFGAGAARAQADLLAPILGQLPGGLRAGIARASAHAGEEGFHAGTGQIVLYAGTMDGRATCAHLEESVFHEAVHASWDEAHRLAPDWIAAQDADGGFLTAYAADSPEREDLAETALFAFALLRHPDRLPPADGEATRRAVPHRIAYIAGLLGPETLADPAGTCAAGE